MRTVKLNTGVVINFDDKDNMLKVTSPYVKGKPIKMSILQYMRLKIKAIIDCSTDLCGNRGQMEKLNN
ncbi:MAG: hypothetical protein KDC67_16610 [Ignavibacteriae bacterium]|nr:hypothetical protein [Ignavibacteriota bacterium]